MLNEPVGFENEPDDDWTPTIGLRRGLVVGLCVGLVMAAGLAIVARHLPLILLPLWLRGPLAFALAYLLCGLIERAAGMSDGRCVLLAVGITAAVLVSNHVVLAAAVVLPGEAVKSSWMFPLNIMAGHFAPVTRDFSGRLWLHPYVLAGVNVAPVTLAGAFLAALKRR